MREPKARAQVDGYGGTRTGDMAQKRTHNGIRSESGAVSEPAQAGFQGRYDESDMGIGFHLRADGRGLAVPVHFHRPVQPPRGRLGSKQNAGSKSGDRRPSERRGEPAPEGTAGDPYGSRLSVYIVGLQARGCVHRRHSEHEPPGYALR